jgi:hypothetical protein
MRFKHRYSVVLVILGCLLLAVAANARGNADSKRTVIIPRVAKGPVFDGVMGDQIWTRGALMSNFVSVTESAKPIQQTTARVLYDAKYLYIGVKCSEENMASIVAQAKGADNGVWKDDEVEVFMDTTNAHHSYYHILRNSRNGYRDVKCVSAGEPDGTWVCHTIVKTGQVPGGWCLEIAVPFADLGSTPKPGIVWGINVCRGREAGGQEFSAWSPTHLVFDEPKSFGRAVFSDGSAKWTGIRLTSWGDLDPENAPASENILHCSLPNLTTKAASFQAVLSESTNGKITTAATKIVTVQPGKTAELAIPYQASTANVDAWLLSIKSKGRQLFDAEHHAVSTLAEQRVWKLKDPLYNELLSNTPPGDQRFGAIYWIHTYQPSLDMPFAEEYGLRYSNEEALKEFADAKLLPLTEAPQLRDPFLIEMADKYRYKVLFYPDISRWTAPDAPKVGDASFILDPRSKEHYFTDLKAGLAKWRKYIWGVYTGDEITETALHQAVVLYIDHKNDYPFIRQVNEDVKRQYGFGKYGMPESLDDSNPYRWIALRRWVMAQLADWQKEVYQTVQSTAPEIRVISFDPVAGHKPVGFDRMAPYFDIATQQLYPPTDPNRQQFGFTSKMVSDLTGKPTWPCTHVEHYPYSTTLEEVHELLSEVMRSGGKGFHFWLKDEVGNNADHGFMMATKWGFPERWRALKELNTLNAQMNEVAVPKDPDLSILYSEDYYQSMSEKIAEYPYGFPNEPEWAYTFFGPVARTWFKFVNDNMIEDGKVDLSAFKAVVVPAAKYERKSVVEALNQYVTAGGTLVIGDPEAFTTDVDGTPLTELKASLIGAACTPGRNESSLTFSADCSMPGLRNRTLHVYGSGCALKADAGAEVMAVFPDGSPAVLRNRVGKGSVITFAVNPFTESGIADEGWKSVFKALSEELGVKVDRDIWRFEFPPYKTVRQPEPAGICLTGNYIKWWQDKPSNVQNAVIAGTYSYSVAPDKVADRGGSKSVPFSTGKLTDRTKAYTTLKEDLRPEDFTVTWKTEKPTSIVFDLLEPRAVTRLNLWYSGQLPDLKVEGSVDRRSWARLADCAKKPMMTEPDVLDISLDIAARNMVRYLRVSLGDRDPGSPMTLAECEIWGAGK